MSMSLSNPPKALLFDCFGTVVDWKSSISKALITTCAGVLNGSSTAIPSAVRAKASSITDDQWGEYAFAWAKSYAANTSSYDPTTGEDFVIVDELLLRSLRVLLNEWGLEGFYTDEEVERLSRAWHFLDPFPDSSAGIALLNTKFITATLSNGNISLLQDMADFAHLPWTVILSAEMFRVYKPNPVVYNGAAEKLGLKTRECAMVAAHVYDLAAARQQGFQTIYVERRGEELSKDEDEEVREARGWVDVWISKEEEGLTALARRLGCTG